MNKKLCFTQTLSALFVFFASGFFAQTFPTGFSQVKIVAMQQATAMTIDQDGRIFVCQRDGTVRIIKNGALLPTPFLKLTTDQNGERGVSGILLDPDFATNHYVYIYYSATTPSIHNRLSRFTANGDVAVNGSETVLFDADPVSAVFHNGGGMVFGNDGKLYLSMGEDNKPSNSQTLTTMKGKLLRMNKDGSAPSDNPYYNSTNEQTRRIWCTGLRNPYTMAIQRSTGRIFINNVGADSFEEINDGSVALRNFGWPTVEGYGSDPTYTDPFFAYPHISDGLDGCAVTGGTFFEPANTNYPAMYKDKYFYMDYCKGWIYYLTLGANPTNTKFATGLTTKNLALQVGPDGNMYYLNRDDVKGGVYKIIYSASNAPSITSQPQSQTVVAGQQAVFSVSASGITPLNYQWKKNGTSISGATASTYTINNVQISNAGQYSCVVTNSAGTATSNNATLTVTGYNAPPDAAIVTPTSGTLYHAGDVISFSGNATDAEDGNLPASAFQWEVEFHHGGTHFHPGPGCPQGVKSGTFTIPNDGETSSNVFYRLKLKVTDSNGLIDTLHVDLHPATSQISVNTVPPGLQFRFDSQPKTTPFTQTTVEGLHIPIAPYTPQTSNGITYVFDHWMHGGPATQTVTVGANDVTFTAVYKDTLVACEASGSILREYWKNYTGTTLSGAPFNNPPTGSSQLYKFEGPIGFGDNYVSRIRGYICPPQTGNYTFYIASDNNSELWLSNSSDPAGKVKIASVDGYTASREWTKYPSQKSAPVTLSQGIVYYIEAIHREGTQGDNLAVGWQLPDLSYDRPISGSYLSPFIATTNTPSVAITSPANNSSFPSGTDITINATATSAGGGITKVEFYYGTTKIGEDASSPYSMTWNDVQTGNYVVRAVAYDNAGQNSSSDEVNISVTGCVSAKITPMGPTTFCSGSVVLQASMGSGFMYQWEKNGNDIDGATSSTYTATSTGDYQVRIIQGACMSWSAPMHVNEEPGLNAAITASGPTSFCTGGSVTLYANTCPGNTYQWRRNGTNISGATTQTYTATTGGDYQVKVTLNGQDDWSANVKVIANSCSTAVVKGSTYTTARVTQREEITDSSLFRMTVFPNPNTGLFTIELNMNLLSEEKVKMTLVNLLGQPVYTKEFVATDNTMRQIVELDPTLPTGIYTLQVLVGGRVANTSVVLSRK
jgi:glucose/arabinose dehydrogenase